MGNEIDDNLRLDIENDARNLTYAISKQMAPPVRVVRACVHHFLQARELGHSALTAMAEGNLRLLIEEWNWENK